MTGAPSRAWPRLGLVVAAASVVLAFAYLFFVWRPAQPGYSGGRPAFRPVALDPAGRYEVTLWDEAVPVPGDSYAARAAAWARDFMASHPNVRVQVTTFPPGELAGALAKALTAGRPPDVVAAPADWPAVRPAWLVPLAPYLERPGANPRPGRVPAPDPALSRLLSDDEGAPAAFPRWLAAWWWVADSRALPQAAEGPAGFDLGAALAGAAAGAAGRGAGSTAGLGELGVAVDQDGLRAAQEVLASAPSTPRGWAQAAGLLARLRPLASSDAFLAFVTGRVPLLAGATPPALSQVRLRLPWAVPVAPPGVGPPAPVLGAAGVYVFYQRPYAGAAHTEAAVLVADAYAAWSDAAVRDALGVIPAGPSAREAAMAAWPAAWRAAAEWALARVAAGDFVRFPPDWSPPARAAWQAFQPAVAAWARGAQAGVGRGPGPAGPDGAPDLAAAARAAWAAAGESSR